MKLPKFWIDGKGTLPIALFFLVASIVVFAPAISRPSLFQVFGGDAYHNLWIWSRNVSNLLAGSAPYSPNIFFPDPMSSFYSEMEIGNSLLYGLLSAFGLHPIRSYLVIVILAFALTGIMVALIARRLGASTPASILGGTIASFASYRYSHLPHVQLLATYWMLIPLYFSLAYLIDGKRRDLILTFISHIPIFGGPSYNLVALFVLESGVFLTFVLNSKFDVRIRLDRAAKLAASIILAVLLTTPFWIGYLELFQKGLDRDRVLAPHAIDLSSFLTPPNGSAIYGAATEWINSAGQQTLSINAFFIGYIALGLIAAAVFRRPTSVFVASGDATGATRYLRTLQWVGLVMLAISLGKVVLWHKLYVMPNPIFEAALKAHLLSSTRYIAHYAYFGLVALSIVMACRYGALHLSSGGRFRWVWPIGLAVLIMVENFVVYSPALSTLPDKLSETPRVYHELAKLPSRKGIVFLPLPTHPNSVDGTYRRQFEYMFNAHHHRLSMFNGISGFFPPHYAQGVGLLAEFPNLPGLNFILKNNIEYVINDKHSARSMDFSKARTDSVCGALSSIYSDADYEIFQVNQAQATECVAKAGAAALAQWIYPASTATLHQIGKFNGSSKTMVATVGEQGALAFGPYVVLEAGKYRARFSIVASEKNDGIELGSVDVSGYSDKTPSSIYKKVPIVAGPAKQELRIDFEVVNPSLKHEFRVWSNGSGRIEFHTVSIEKL